MEVARVSSSRPQTLNVLHPALAQLQYPPPEAKGQPRRNGTTTRLSPAPHVHSARSSTNQITEIGQAPTRSPMPRFPRPLGKTPITDDSTAHQA